ncbi:MAG TPA: serine/threonine-protein kinase [Chthoniobacterales bacterium]|nr:serine/threonine-protein kinase [Chthoniobacterales bacterium]
MSNAAPGNGLDATARELTVGQKLFNRYTLKRTLGRGGMGIVWLARDEELERDVALKFLPDLIIHDRAVLGDLKRETRRSLELTHKNIVRIYDFVHDDVSGCISMEYVDGDTLSNLRADKPHKVFEPKELKEWVSELCDALDYAHNHARIVHRDLKPSNLMVNQRGDLKVADFGIARSLSDSMSMLTTETGKSGTLLYMSPQQLDGERGDHLDDVYSLGASIYELLTSRPPFYSGNIDRQIREKVAPSMTQRRKDLEVEGGPIDEAWEEVVRKCLAKDRTKRPQSITEIARQLEVPSPKTRRGAHDAPAQPGKWGSVIGAVMIISMIAAGGWYFGFYRNFTKAPTAVTSEVAPAAAQPASTTAAAPPIPAAPAVGGFVVDTSPSGATVTLAGKDVGKTPATFKDIRPGRYPMRLVLDGYDPIEKEVEVKENEFTNLGSITLSRAKAVMELSSEPSGAKVFLNGALIGTTPMRREDLTPGEATYVLFLEGYLPREVKASLDPRQIFKKEVPLMAIASMYAGTIHEKNNYNSFTPYSVPLTITLASDLKSGTMTQSGKRGDFVVRFNGVWEGTELHAVTGDVISQPSAIKWTPEAFTLRFAEDGKRGSYLCVGEGKTYSADLSAESANAATASSIYKGTIDKYSSSPRPLTINLSADRKSGTMTQSSKSGDVVVRFNGVWDGAILHAVTDEVLSKPANIKWDPESFTLRFEAGGRSGSYECKAEGHTYTAQLSAP